MTTFPIPRIRFVLPFAFAMMLPYSMGAQAVSEHATTTVRYPLQELRARAEARQQSIAQARLTVEQARKGESAARAARLPKLDVTASYSHLSEVGHINFSIPGLLSRSIAFGDGNVYDAALSASMPLFTGFRLTNTIEQQEQQRLAAEQTLASAILEVRTSVAVLYRTAQLAMTSETILAGQQVLLTETLAQRSALLAQGQALPLDTLQLATRIAQIDVDRASARTQYQRAILELMAQCDLDQPFDIEPFEGARTGPEQRANAELLEAAVQSRGEFRALQATARTAELAAANARAASLPSVYASAAYHYGRPGVDQIANQWMDYYTAGVRLEWNLWSWGADRSNEERAQLDVEKARSREAQLRLQVRTRIDATLDELLLRARTIDLLGRQIALEREKLVLVQARLREGLATTTDVVDAETSLTTALLRLEQARIEHVIKQTELAATAGYEF